ncbi:MAG: hypothetical protein ACFBWO_05860 [Paracoccaceae bacterium]
MKAFLLSAVAMALIAVAAYVGLNALGLTTASVFQNSESVRLD